MRSENFNEQAMEEKIRLNNSKGISNPQIKIILREEMIANLKKISALEMRNVELHDQIDYMETKHG
jgi:hypothetical protein